MEECAWFCVIVNFTCNFNDGIRMVSKKLSTTIHLQDSRASRIRYSSGSNREIARILALNDEYDISNFEIFLNSIRVRMYM